MNCNDCKDLLIEFSEGLLDKHSKENMEQHLEECSECRKEAENIFALKDRLLKNSHAYSSTNLEDRVMKRIAREQNTRLKATSSAGFIYQIRRFFMKYALLKIAATAVVVLAVFIGLNFTRNNVSFAQVVEPLLHARTLEYDLAIPGQGTFHDIVAEGRIRRSIHNLSRDMIIDVDNLSVLNLDTVHKTAETTEVKTEAAKMSFDITRDFLKLVQGAVEEALNGAPSAVKKLGKKTIDGYDVFGFKLPSETDGEKVIIWADSDTALPVQVDIHLGTSYPDRMTTKIDPSAPGMPRMKAVIQNPKNYILKNIWFDVPVDELLMEMPSDYRLIDATQFHLLLMENGFVNMLRLWLENLSDGFFPENLPSADSRNLFMRDYPNIMKWTPEEREELITDEVLKTFGLEYAAKQFLIDLSSGEWEDFLISVGYGFGFINSLGNSNTEWQYSGSGVQLGEGDREIFRYKMPEFFSWRVIYGNLHSEDLID